MSSKKSPEFKLILSDFLNINLSEKYRDWWQEFSNSSAGTMNLQKLQEFFHAFVSVHKIIINLGALARPRPNDQLCSFFFDSVILVQLYVLVLLFLIPLLLLIGLFSDARHLPSKKRYSGWVHLWETGVEYRTVQKVLPQSSGILGFSFIISSFKSLNLKIKRYYRIHRSWKAVIKSMKRV